MGLRDHLASDVASMLSTDEFARTVTLFPRSSQEVDVSAIFDSSLGEAEGAYGVDAWATISASDGSSLQIGSLIEVGTTDYRVRKIEVLDEYSVSLLLERQ